MSQFEALIQVWIDEVAALNTNTTGNTSNTTTRPDELFLTPYPADENAYRGHCGGYSKRESPFASPLSTATKRRRVSSAIVQRTGGRRSERRSALVEANTNSCSISNSMASSNEDSGPKQPTHLQRRTSPRKRATPTQPPSGVTDEDQRTPTTETDVTTPIMPPSVPSSVPTPVKAQGNATISNTSYAAASTSTSTWSKALSITGQGFPLLRRPATASCSSTVLSSSAFSKKTTGTTRSSRARSRSPIKSMADLRFADIEMRSLSDSHALGALPETTRDLIARFQDVDDGIQVVPALIRPQAEAAMGKSVRPHNVAEQYHLTPDDALRELQGLLDIVGDAASCQLECQSELAWNALVHCRVFQWALAQSAGKTMKSWLTTTATIVPELAPRTGPLTDDATTTASKMVDFCLTIEPGRPDQVDDMLSRQPHERLYTLNQTMYAPLRFRPVAVAVETKIDTAASTGETQLGIWTKAWLNRVSLLLGLPSGAAPAPAPPPLPVIRIRGHEWFVLISYLEDGDKRTQVQIQLDSTGTRTQTQPSDARQKGPSREGVNTATATTTTDVGVTADSQTGNTIEDQDQDQDQPTSRTRHDDHRRQKHLVILSEQAIGNTRSVLGAYKLLKAIRVLADWAEGDFRAYIDGVVIPGAAKQWRSSCSASASICSA
ncbi:hypothetical protein ANO14919_131270 [Xylariales sp. No.14919]|nr:hypothetical protein ANO14919_131270 [Xylariales sp. No.14919]